MWQAPAALGRALGVAGFDHEGSAAVFAEIAASVPQYTGLSYDALDARITGVTWPLLWNNQEGSVLYTGGFSHPDGRAKLTPVF